MNKYIASMVVAALMAVPTFSRAEDKPAAALPEQTAPAAKKHIPFHGKVAAVDVAAATVTVGKLVLHVTSETKILKDDKPATMADITVGEKIAGNYKKIGDKLEAGLVRIGEKVPKGKPAPVKPE